MYRSVAESDNALLIETFAGRVDAATAATLATASDAVFDDLPTGILTLLSTIFARSATCSRRNLPKAEEHDVRALLSLMYNFYLKAVRFSL